MTRPRRLQILPGFGLSLGMSLLFVALILLLPLSGLALNLAQLTLADYWNIVSDGQTLAALRVTFWAAAWASLFNALFGLLLAWVLTRYRFPGRVFVDALVDLPFALPTAVAGIALATLFAKDGWLGQPLAALGRAQPSETLQFVEGGIGCRGGRTLGIIGDLVAPVRLHLVAHFLARKFIIAR